MMRRVVLSLLVAAPLLVGGTPAHAAANCTAPPGTAAVEQYCEAVPDADGNAVSRDRAAGLAGTGRVSAPVAARLERAGADGAAVVRFAGGAAAPARRSRARHRAPSVPVDGSSAPAPPADDPLRAVVSAARTGPTAGGGLVWVLIGGAIVAAGVAWRRRVP